MKRTFTNLAFILSILFITNSCGLGLIVRGTAKKSLTVEKKTVPPNFIEKDETLLILLWGDAYDKYAEKAFNKFYAGKKKYVTFDQYFSGEYPEEEYPFVFSQGPGSPKMYSGESYSFTFEGSRPFHIYDRRSKEFYKARVTSGFFARVIQAYAIRLDEIRIERK